MARSGTGYRLGGSVKGKHGSRYQMAQWALSPPRHGGCQGGPDKRARQTRGTYSRVVGDAEGAVAYVVWERIACVQIVYCVQRIRVDFCEVSLGFRRDSLTLII